MVGTARAATRRRQMLARLAGVALLGAPLLAQDARPAAGERGGPGLAIRCAKALVLPPDPSAPQAVDRALVLIRDGVIVEVRPEREGPPPEGFELLDAGDAWCMPGMVELHCHEGGTYDINDMVYLANPGLRASASVIGRNERLERGLASGVTSVLYIPGSGTNVGGSGVLLKTAFEEYEKALIRDPGSLKLAQWGNPESWTLGVGMSLENWNTRNVFRRGLAYAAAWREFEAGRGPQPERDVELDVFRDLLEGRAQVSTHTQVYQVVLMTLTMIKGELGLDVFLDHSTIGGWLTGALAQEMGVSAIVGPRSIDPTSRGMINWARNKHEGMRGIAAGYQERGLENVGFNTDSPVIPEEELSLQAGMAVRYGFEDDGAQAVRGLTIVPAMTVGIDDQVGCLLPGRDADVVLLDGHPADPRTSVRKVLVDGELVYDASEERLW